MEEHMESELSGIFRVKLVTKNIERGSQGTQSMHMRVNVDKMSKRKCQLKSIAGDYLLTNGKKLFSVRT